MQQKPVEQEPPRQPDWAQHTDMPVGEVLRRTRAWYDLTIEEVERALHIKAVHLRALEEGRIEILPGRVYAIGFIRAYAEFLGLDGDKIVHLFKAQLVGAKPRPELNFPASASESKLPGGLIIAGTLACLLAIAATTYFIKGRPEPIDVPPVPAAIRQETAVTASYGPPEPETLADVTGPETMGPFLPESRIEINVTGTAWVEIRNGEGKALLSRILKEGDSYIVPNEDGLVMDTGDMGALRFTVDGAELPPVGEEGDVRRSVPLDPVSLKAAASGETGAPSPTTSE